MKLADQPPEMHTSIIEVVCVVCSEAAQQTASAVEERIATQEALMTLKESGWYMVAPLTICPRCVSEAHAEVQEPAPAE